jgi:hypothetical protein
MKRGRFLRAGSVEQMSDEMFKSFDVNEFVEQVFKQFASDADYMQQD